MIKNVLGETNLNVSNIGFGGIPIQRLEKTEAIKVVKSIFNHGINFIDSARGYSVSEEYIGQAIKDKRDKVILATKTMVRDYEGMKKEIEVSLSNFQTDYIDLYQFHFIKTEEQLEKILSDDGAYKALEEAKTAGKIGHIGITGHNAELMMKAINTEKFETIQFPFNPIESQGVEMFKRAKELNMGTIAMKPIAGGAIDQGELSLKYILSKDFIDVAIPGMDSIALVEKNANIGKGAITLTNEEMEKINAFVEDIGTDFCRRCGYCAPCPQGIDIPLQFIFEGYLTRYDIPEWAIDRYNAQKIKADACIQCGICETRCPYDLPIIEMMKKVDQAFTE